MPNEFMRSMFKLAYVVYIKAKIGEDVSPLVDKLISLVLRLSVDEYAYSRKDYVLYVDKHNTFELYTGKRIPQIYLRKGRKRLLRISVNDPKNYELRIADELRIV